MENKKQTKEKVKYVKLTWKQFDAGVKKLTKQIIASGKEYDGIMAIPRGGLCLGVALSHSLNLPLTNGLFTSKTLIVDDISDTGKTLDTIYYKDIVTLVYTKWTVRKPTYSVYEKKSKQHWIIFPWESQK